MAPHEPAESRRPTMRDVAAEAGVSLKTVSRVINNTPTVDPVLVEKVRGAVARLGFRRNEIARRLRAGQTVATVGLVIEDIANPFYSAIAAGAAQVASGHDALLITASSEADPAREQDLVLELCARRVDGLLVVPAGADQSYLRPEVELGIPVVFLDRPGGGLLADTVLVDNAGGARSAVERLLATGHRRIGILLESLVIYTMRERLGGAQAAHMAAGVRLDDALVVAGLHTPDAAARAVTELLDEDDPPTAFFCGNNRVVVGVLEELVRRGSDAEVAAFDDFELARLMPRPLAVVGYDNRLLGRIAAEMLFKRIAGDTALPTMTILPTRLTERGLRLTGPGVSAGH